MSAASGAFFEVAVTPNLALHAWNLLLLPAKAATFEQLQAFVNFVVFQGGDLLTPLRSVDRTMWCDALNVRTMSFLSRSFLLLAHSFFPFDFHDMLICQFFSEMDDYLKPNTYLSKYSSVYYYFVEFFKANFGYTVCVLFLLFFLSLSLVQCANINTTNPSQQPSFASSAASSSSSFSSSYASSSSSSVSDSKEGGHKSHNNSSSSGGKRISKKSKFDHPASSSLAAFHRSGSGDEMDMEDIEDEPSGSGSGGKRRRTLGDPDYDESWDCCTWEDEAERDCMTCMFYLYRIGLDLTGLVG